MSNLKYEYPKVKKSISKIWKICTMKENRLFLILLAPLLLGILVANHIRLKCTSIFEKIIKESDMKALNSYVFNFIIFIILNLTIALSFDILFTRFYCTCQKVSLRDYITLEYNKFKSRSIGDLSLRQFEKGESASELLYSIVPEGFSKCSYLLQSLYVIYKEADGILLLITFSAVVLHFTLIYKLNPKLNFLQKTYTLDKVNASSTVENESKNFDILKTYNMEEQSKLKVKKLLEKRKESKINLSIFTRKIDLFFKLIDLTVLVLVLTLDRTKYITFSISMFLLTRRIIVLFETTRLFISQYLICNDKFGTFYVLENDIERISNGDFNITEFKELELKNVSFANIFSNLNVKINKNDKVAIIGHNSSGKTVLIKGMIGFLKFDGQVLYNEVDIKDIDIYSLRKHISYVSQVALYTTGTVMDNLKYGNNCSEEEVKSKCVEFGVDYIFSELDQGYNKHSHSGGLELSGGQRQRVNFMRGILRNTYFN